MLENLQDLPSNAHRWTWSIRLIKCKQWWNVSSRQMTKLARIRNNGIVSAHNYYLLVANKKIFILPRNKEKNIARLFLFKILYLWWFIWEISPIVFELLVPRLVEFWGAGNLLVGVCHWGWAWSFDNLGHLLHVFKGVCGPAFCSCYYVYSLSPWFCSMMESYLSRTLIPKKLFLL